MEEEAETYYAAWRNANKRDIRPAPVDGSAGKRVTVPAITIFGNHVRYAPGIFH